MISGNYPATYILFDGILCWLDSDFLDAHLFFENAFRLGLINLDLYKILLVMTKNGPLCYGDNDCFNFMKLLGLASMPVSASFYVHLFGPEFKRRLEILSKNIFDLLPWLRKWQCKNAGESHEGEMEQC